MQGAKMCSETSGYNSFFPSCKLNLVAVGMTVGQNQNFPASPLIQIHV